MPPRRNSYDEISSFVDPPRDSMSPDLQQARTTDIPYSKTSRFLQLAKRQKSTSGDSTTHFLGSHSTSTDPTPTAASLLSKPSSHPGFPNFPCFQCVIPDNSPTILYNGLWILNVGPQSSTTHSTTVSGSTFSLRFNGSAIIVVGVVPASNDTFQPPTAVYWLDQQQPFPTTLPRAATNVPNQPLFASFNLSDDEHTLVVNVTDVSAPYSLQKFFVYPRGSNPQDMIGRIPTGGIGSTSFSSFSRTADVTSPTAQIAPATSSVLYSKDASPKSFRTLAVVLATLALLVLTGTIVFFIFRRRIIAKRRLAVEVSCPAAANARPDTIYTSWTSTESILRNDDLWSSPFRSPRSQNSRTDGRVSGPRSFSDRRSTIDFAPPPLPPKPALLSSYSKPG